MPEVSRFYGMLRMVRHWAEEHYEELLDNWERGRMRINMRFIDPLE